MKTDLYEVHIKVRRRAETEDAAREQIAAVFGLTLTEVHYALKANEPKEITSENISEDGITFGMLTHNT